MSDLHTLMARATAGTDVPPSPGTVAADLARGRAARRRRTGRFTGLGVAAVLAVGLAVGLPTTTGTAPAAAVPLVAYVGDQPAGFLLDTVPEGWRVVASWPGELVLAGADDDGENPGSYVGRIVVNLVDRAGTPLDAAEGGTVRVDGTDVLVHELLGATGPDGYRGAWVPLGDGQDALYVQVPPEVRWSAQDVARFAVGITVTADAQKGVG